MGANRTNLRAKSTDAWRAELRAAIGLHDLVCSGHKLVGGQEDAIESARLHAVAVMDRAKAAGVTDEEIEAEFAAYREGHPA